MQRPIRGEGWSDDFKTPTQVAVTCCSPAHIVDRNLNGCTSHDSPRENKDRAKPNKQGREGEGKERTGAEI